MIDVSQPSGKEVVAQCLLERKFDAQGEDDMFARIARDRRQGVDDVAHTEPVSQARSLLALTCRWYGRWTSIDMADGHSRYLRGGRAS